LIPILKKDKFQPYFPGAADMGGMGGGTTFIIGLIDLKNANTALISASVICLSISQGIGGSNGLLFGKP